MTAIKIVSDYKSLSESVADVVIETVVQKPDAVLCFPSGDTPLGLFELLVEKSKKGLIDLSKCIFIGLDEWLGMDENDEGSCKYTIYQNLLYPLDINKKAIHFFDAKTNDQQAECQRIDQIISALDGIDLMILGVGMNGHLGLNEPGVDVNLWSHTVDLDEVTKVIGQKYFSQKTPLNKGITLGIQNIMNSRKVVVMISGKHKASIAKEVLEGKISNQVSASLLRNHADAYYFLDKDASKLLVPQ
jgi:glucosamine-6-phosphate isomerase